MLNHLYPDWFSWVGGRGGHYQLEEKICIWECVTHISIICHFYLGRKKTSNVVSKIALLCLAPLLLYFGNGTPNLWERGRCQSRGRCQPHSSMWSSWRVRVFFQAMLWMLGDWDSHILPQGSQVTMLLLLAASGQLAPHTDHSFETNPHRKSQ